jgi:cysteinyl-tRNA synthetase
MFKLYNTLSRKKETFKSIKKSQVGIYVCGPTIYDYGHLGHGRSAVNFDIIRRFFQYKKYKVNFVFNYTDIDDNMITRANKLKITVKELAKKFSKIYDEDYKKLNILKPTKKPKPTENIKEIIEKIKKLEKKGYTYNLDDGVYFNTLKFKEYGKLSKQNLKQLKEGVRVKSDENKKSKHDFVLWKLEKPGEPSWQSSWGKGRPGWHIECSAMSSSLLGQPFDIHGGGQDLIFPHHENEIAQAQAGEKKKFANYWMHNGFIQVNKEKMSKSLGNFTTLRDIFKKYNPLVVRYMYISAHYRMPIDFSGKNLDQAKSSLERIKNFVLDTKNSKNKLPLELIKKTKEKFIKAMEDDFDTPKALAVIFEFIREANKVGNGKNAYPLMLDFDNILGLDLSKTEEIPKEIKDLAEKREKARKEKDWSESDKLRDKINKKGYEIKDSKEGYSIKKK